MSEQSNSAGCGGPGCGLGSIVALMLSVKTWGWTWWAALHFLCGWWYVAYWAIFLWGGIK